MFTGYSYVQSLQVIKVLPSLRAQITQQNLPFHIKRLQCIFIESFCIAVLAVFELSKSLGASELSPNEIFHSKRESEQAYCVKQRILDKTARFQLLQKCNVKVIKKSCATKKIRYVGVRKFIGAYSFINKVLQCVII